MSLCGNCGTFVGRGFSHDINAEESMRLQPLKFRFAVATQTQECPSY